MVVSLKRLTKQLTSLVVLPSMMLLLTGCELSDLALFSSKGPVNEGIGNTMIYTVLMMLTVVIPTIILSVYIPYKYRASNEKAEYKPEWSHSTVIEYVVWGIPILIIFILALEVIETSRTHDPREPIVSVENPEQEPLKIQVVALDWKWLFIYPEEGIAVVNEISIPVDRPVQFLLTSDGAINSFFIPQLGGQLYAMSGMENKINLMATEKGVYFGQSANYSGYGFTGMRFNVLAKDAVDYDKWISNVKNSNKTLNDETYSKLRIKSRDNKVEYFVNPDPLRFKNIIEEVVGLTGEYAKRQGHDAHGKEDHAEHDEHESHDTHGKESHEDHESHDSHAEHDEHEQESHEAHEAHEKPNSH